MVRDILAAGRVANLPTVVTNVIVGLMLGMATLGEQFSAEEFLGGLVVVIAGCCLYLAGCFYNDYHDRHWDAQHKPDRAIPAGRVPAHLMLVLILSTGIIGIGLCVFTGILSVVVCVLILLFIYIYTRIHKKTALGIIPMGLCRAGLYFLGIVAVRDMSVWEAGSLMYIQKSLWGHVCSPAYLPGLGLMCYIAGITLVARSEAMKTLPKWAKWVGLCLLVVPCWTHTVSDWGSLDVLKAILPALLLVFWAKRSVESSIGGFVSKCLGAICFLDFVLMLNIRPITMELLPICVLGLGGMALAFLLQRVAPAT